MDADMGNTALKRDDSVRDRANPDTENPKTPLAGVPSPKVLDLTEACEMLGIAKVTMYGYLKKGIIPAFKYPGSRVWKFEQAALEKWVRDQQGKGGRK